MIAYLKVWQDVFRGASRELLCDEDLMALNALRYSRLYYVSKDDCSVAEKLLDDFEKENPGFQFDNATVIFEQLPSKIVIK